ncbi:MAG: hypothetical protein K2X48_01115 [Chitinophagaceae bacterium]|nr:hypothetical protein [Chitinophagaceae bacterium]
MKTIIFSAAFFLLTSFTVHQPHQNTNSFTTSVKKLNDPAITFFKAFKNRRDVNLFWYVSNPLNIASFTIFYSTDGVMFYELESMGSTGNAMYRYKHRPTGNGTIHYKIQMRDVYMGITESPVETVRLGNGNGNCN